MASKNLQRILCALFLCTVFELTAQKKITVDDFTTKSTFATKLITGINWMNDGKYYTTLTDNKVVRYDITTGQQTGTIVDGNTLPMKIAIDGYSFSADEQQLLLATQTTSIYRRSYVADYYVYNIPKNTFQKLSDGGKQSYAAFSPDGTRVAFVRQNNLFTVNLVDMREEQITDDGKFNYIINGTTDWVYEEEFGFVVGFNWSPDGRRISYYRFDESAVKEYNMQVWGKKNYPYDYRFKYPKAGEANSSVEIWIHDLSTKQKVKADLGSDADFYIPRVTWSNNPEILAVRKMNRLQNELLLFHVDASTGKSTVALTEKSDTYVDVEFVDDLVYLKDKKHFICASERSGYKHLYLYTIDGKLVRPLTSGSFDVVQFYGIDEKSKTIYYQSTEPSPLERHLYSINLDGKKKTRMTSVAGQHNINLSADYQFYIAHRSSGSAPTAASLFKTKGNTLIKDLENNQALVQATQEYGVVEKEFFSFQSNGTQLNGYYLKPKNFVAGRKYPVLLYQYSGPGSQNAGNNWAGNHFYFHQMLTQHDIIVAVVDPRGTGGRGENFKKVTYKELGKFELEDIVATANYFKTQPFIDGDRMGVWGWSYGGYMSALAMTKAAGTFKLGIAVSPVTNWRFYDTVYTERYLRTPQENAKGYDENSPLQYAEKLTGKFLLIHGTGDDNVHVQNSMVFQESLIQAGKTFESFFYPDKHHGIQGSKTRHHLYNMMFSFVSENL
jgi:dipeptidyl-peptidase 4